MDAMLGAAALGDIGQHFPNTDPRYKGISSIELLKRVAALFKKSGLKIGNIDSMVIAEAPRLAPHIEAMRKNIAAACEIELNRVSVKATTNEGVGFIGRGEGIAAQAVAMIS
jgi:2-C-methyl-D-erythritol 2,4-cyclodiphosphate synthase